MSRSSIGHRRQQHDFARLVLGDKQTRTDPALDLIVFATVPVVLVIVALVACFIPARRATRVSPVEALRN
jgi:ABC-type lipoprotein release transport system permease subunit